MGLAMLVLTGCDGHEQRRAAELSRLGPAIDQLRQAPNRDKAEFLERLRSIPCEDVELCALRSLCLAAYERHTRALKTIDLVKAKVARPEADGLEAALDTAKQDLHEAGKRAQECARRRATLAAALEN